MLTGVKNMDLSTANKLSPKSGLERESTCIGHEPCPECGSKDNLGRYDDGHGYCFGCEYRESATGVTVVQEASKKELLGKKISDSTFTPISGRSEELEKRGISKETCKRFGYFIGQSSGARSHVANFYSQGKIVGQKIRLKNKEFKTLGDCSGLWGKHLWGKGKKIVITEGEIDCLSVAEVQNCKWPVVSLPNGVLSAKKAVSKDLEWLLEGFEEIILMFDMDEPGQKAVKVVTELFPPGRCKSATLSEKDANELLLKGRGSEIISAIWNAKTHRPDGIVAGEDTWDLVNTPMSASDQDYPWKGLNEYTLGARRGEIVTFCAGTGAGKSTAVKEIASYFLSKGETIGYIALEESVRQAAVDFMSIEANKMLHLEKDLNEKYFRDIWEKVFGSNRLFLYDHWGSIDSEVLSNRIRYLARSCGVRWIVLDHISIMVSGVEGGDERRLIDNTMTNLRSLAEELTIGMFVVSHLKRPYQGKGHEEGRQVNLSDLRGSGSIAQLSDFVIGLERNQQVEGETTVRVLKARLKGSKTGVAQSLYYDEETGRLHECGLSVGTGGLTGMKEEF